MKKPMQLPEMEKFTSRGLLFCSCQFVYNQGGAPSLLAPVAAAKIWKTWEILGLLENFGIDGKIWTNWKFLDW